jgi:pSer/pThr/pTyr-binding forkhead associated (FHA) protein
MQLEFGGQRVPIAAGELVIGSDPTAAIVLAGLAVLPKHATVRLAGSGYPVLTPGASYAMIEVNGNRVGREPTPLLHGDRIRIAGYEIAVADPERATETRAGGPAAAAGGSEAPGGTRRGPPGRLVSLTDGREYPLDSVPFMLGREATAQVVIGSPDAARRHAEIATRPDGDVLVDLSATGTFVNGKRIEGRQPLKALDVIRIGAEEFRYYPPAPVLPRSSLAPAGAEYRLNDTLAGMPAARRPPAQAVRAERGRSLADLLVRRGTAKGERLPVRSPTVNIGRADYNDVRLPDPSVSATHAKLQLREGVWTLNDLGSTNGTSADGMVVTDEMPLSPGTVITLGEVDLLFEPHDEGVIRDAEETAAETPMGLAPITPAPIPIERSPGVPDAPAPGPTATEARPAPARTFVPPTDGGSSRTRTVVLVVGMVALAGALAALLFLP